MVDTGDVRFFSVVLFKLASLILALLLGLQLVRSQLPFDYDLTRVLTFEQFVFVFAIVVVTGLAIIEGRTLQVREGGTGKSGLGFGVIILYVVAVIGAYFSAIIFLGYSFNDSQTNLYIGYYLLIGTFMIFINAREQIFKRFIK